LIIVPEKLTDVDKILAKVKRGHTLPGSKIEKADGTETWNEWQWSQEELTNFLLGSSSEFRKRLENDRDTTRQFFHPSKDLVKFVKDGMKPEKAIKTAKNEIDGTLPNAYSGEKQSQLSNDIATC